MNISEIFIRRPVMTTLVMIGILFFGFMAYRQLPVSDLPNVDFPTISVYASLPGADPETMASAVATPLERQFSTIAGLDSMTSSSGLGSTSITLQFNLSRQIDAAAQDVQSAIAAAQHHLPPNMPSPPSFRKVNPADTPVLYLALTADTIPIYTLDEYAETIMAQRISTVPGVAQVMVYGSQKYAVRVQLNPAKLATRGIGIDEVASGIRAANANLPTGIIDGPYQAYTVKANGQLMKAAQYRPITIAYRNGAPVHLGDLGNVIDSVQNDRTAAWFMNERGVILAVQKQPGTNAVEVSDAVRSLLPTFRKELPGSIKLFIHRDKAESIRASVNDVKFTLLLTLCLVVLVIFLFLRNVSATVIPSLALPMSIVGTFVVMYMLGYSLDNLSLMALTLSVGFVVDDAIVMLENIMRHIEAGEKPFEAALKGSKEIGFTILSMTLSLAAVFIPVLFMGGILGKLFHEFAVTIGAAILVSGFVSLSLTPMMAARFIKPQREARHSRLYETSERIFQQMLEVYSTGLRWVLGHKRSVLAFSAVVLAATGWLFYAIPKGFLPTEDQGQVVIQMEAAQGISFEDMVRHSKQAMKIVMKQPIVAAMFSAVGVHGGAYNDGFISTRLTPLSERTESAEDLVRILRPELAKIPGLRCFVQIPPPIRLGAHLSKSLYQYTLQAADTTVLYQSAEKMVDKLRTMPDFVDVGSDVQIENPQVTVAIDRDHAAALGLSAQQIEDALYSAYAARQVSTIYAPTNSYQVIMEVEPKYQREANELSLLYVRAASGKLVPLSAFAKLTRSVGPLTVNHSGQLPSVTLSFNLAPGVSLGDAVDEIDGVARQILPSSVTTSFQGTAQAFQSSMKGLGLLLILAIAVIYMVLGILYESFIHPITILSALPFAGFGALLTLMVFHVDLSIYSFVGVIMLVGLVKKNGIMMVDFALEAQKTGITSAEAIYEACRVRFRPIMMTTMAALMGTLPIALGIGAGAESRRPLGLAVVGGLLFSQALTLFVTPVFYVYMDRLRRHETIPGAELVPERSVDEVLVEA